MDARQFDDAHKACLEVLEQEPYNVDAVYLLSMIAREKGCQQEVIDFFLGELIKFPDSPILYNCIGELYFSMQDPDSAEQNYKKALSYNPPFVEIIQYNLGQLYLSRAEYEAAIDTLSQAVTKGEKYADAWFSLGIAYEALFNFDAAIHALQKAIAVNPDFAEAHTMLGNIYRKLNKIDHACQHFQTAVEKRPDHPGMLNNLGLVYRDLGDFPAACEYFRKAITIQPDYIEAYQNLIKIKPDPEYTNKLQDLFENGELSVEEKISMSFSLGDIFDKQQEYEIAFKNYEAGNKLRRGLIEYSNDLHTQFVDSLINFFSSELISQYAQYGSNSNQPVFIVGMPRSGTTLIEQVISSHSEVCGAGELSYIPTIVNQLDQVESYKFPSAIQFIDNKRIKSFADQYLQLTKGYATNEKYIIDKLPENYLYLGLIKILFPNARIIHCKRNKLDTALSIYFNYFTHGNLYAYDIKEIANRYLAYEKVIQHWLSLPLNNLFEVQYEDMVDDPGQTARALVEFMQLQWEPACLEFYNNKRAVMTNSSVQVRNPLYKSSLDRWKLYEPYIGELIAALQ